jgi:16S rRNA (cytosine1402-N4)-methyltransferase
VLVDETLRFLRSGGGLYLDATLGDGGHADALLRTEPEARLLGCDRDPDALRGAATRLAGYAGRVMLAHARFSELPGAHRDAGGEPLAGALFDLGVSSMQIDQPERGMSFRGDGPLDLRMDPTRGLTAAGWLAQAAESEIAAALAEHADLRPVGRLARALGAAARGGTLRTTRDLSLVVERAVGGRPHPRTLARVFQALRIQINDEYGELDAALRWLPEVVRPGGVVVTIAYHSGEDRRIKHAVRGPVRATPGRRLPAPIETQGPPEGPWEELTRRVVTPSPEECSRNPRARSARLRAFRRNSR